jgi:dTDP-4-dehydrorhamnose reductase
MKKVLLVGAGGLMGRYLLKNIQHSTFNIQDFKRSELDITDANKSKVILQEFRPDWVINAAAFCRMEACEEAPEQSQAINATAPAWWARTCHEAGIRLVHLSTDYVFGGGRNIPYTEEDLPDPLSVYARHKREAELAVLDYPEHLVFRLAWIFGAGGTTFMSRIPELLRNGDVLSVATGRSGGCLYADYGAEMILSLLGKLSGGGLYHLTQRGRVTWLDFALECKRQMQERGMAIRNREILSLPLGQHQALTADRPDYSVLDVSKVEAVLGSRLHPWQEGLSHYLEEMDQVRDRSG